ncbi:hypothetical protein [uncultured Polaribacter sp.]|uniref:hypothetical protein n=1 Tax=uncultured Polaribacter sp. TaxID=174711 RepID=UPI00263777A3|nr:hypothetical protein [uncultured Polaribacter sp.]
MKKTRLKNTFVVIKKNTHSTLFGLKKVVELPIKKHHQWVIYKDNKPCYFVDFYDLEKESNAMMNSLVLCTQRTIQEVLDLINKRNNTNLSIPQISRLGLKKKIKSENTYLDLIPMPKVWLIYSL